MCRDSEIAPALAGRPPQRPQEYLVKRTSGVRNQLPSLTLEFQGSQGNEASHVDSQAMKVAWAMGL